MPIILKKQRTIASKLATGVSFDVRTMTHAMRMQVEQEILEASDEVRAFTHEATKRLKGADADSPESMVALSRLQAMDKAVRLPVMVRTAIAAVHGIVDEDGNEISVEEFLAAAPADLIEEAFHLATEAGGLTQDEIKNSESPSTSRSQVDRETSATTVNAV